MASPTSCAPHLHRAWPPSAATAYALPGPQVEPAASYWTDAQDGCPVPCVVTIQQILDANCGLAPYPIDAATIDAELTELRDMASLRDDPAALVSNVPGHRRRPISAFLRLLPQPYGAVFNHTRPHGWCGHECGGCTASCTVPLDNDDARVVETGRELARYFESESPGLAHRLALNYLLRTSNWSPPRQALVWMALDVAIYSALAAAWYFKWRGAAGVSFRPRPIEVDYRVSVLFNRAVAPDGSGDGAMRASPAFPEPSPGTPRHPAYPSGHSTYSAAASEILSYFFPDSTAEFNNLANNIGMARLWAGIHWRSDHTAGAQLGRCIARLLIEQLEDGCITQPPDPCVLPSPCAMPPSKAELDACALECCEPDDVASDTSDSNAVTTGSNAAPSAPTVARGRRGGRRSRAVPTTGGQGTALSSSATVERASSPQEGSAVTGSSEATIEHATSPQQGGA